MSEQQRPKKVVIQEVLRPAPCAGRGLHEGEDQSETKRLLAQAQVARPSAAKGGAANSGGSPPKK